MANVKFNKHMLVSKAVYFEDLQKNENFRLVSPAAKGAVYRKILLTKACGGKQEWMMMEEVTGDTFPPSQSPVERVEVEVTVKADQPSCYSRTNF